MRICKKGYGGGHQKGLSFPAPPGLGNVELETERGGQAAIRESWPVIFWQVAEKWQLCRE